MKNIILLFALFFISQVSFGENFTYLKGNKLIQSNQSVTTNGGTTSLNPATQMKIAFVGTATHTVALPNTASLSIGTEFHILNKSTETISVVDFSLTPFTTITKNQDKTFILFDGGNWLDSVGGSTGKKIESDAPIVITQDETTATVSIPLSTTATDGYLSSTDWNTFNGKENVLTFNSPLIRSGDSVSASVSMADIIDVEFDSLTASQTLIYDGAKWVNGTIISGGGNDESKVNGYGTINYIPKFSATSTITDSSISDDGATVSTTSDLKINTNKYFYFGDEFRFYTSGGALITEKKITGVWTELSRIDEL